MKMPFTAASKTAIFNTRQGPTGKNSRGRCADLCCFRLKCEKTPSLKSGAALWEPHMSFCRRISLKANLETSITTQGCFGMPLPLSQECLRDNHVAAQPGLPVVPKW